jgi:hypothetical protein
VGGTLPGGFSVVYLAPVTSPQELSFGARFFLAFAFFFRILFDGAFAARVLAVKDGMPALPEPVEKTQEREAEPKPLPKKEVHKPPSDGALTLLALLQREGRLVDFLLEDVDGAADADIGAAARVVHSGCRKALRDHVTLETIRGEDEGSKVTLPSGFDAAHTKLTGNVAGTGPYEGTLKHRGWKATDVKLPTALEGHDPKIVAQAEVEL